MSVVERTGDLAKYKIYGPIVWPFYDIVDAKQFA